MRRISRCFSIFPLSFRLVSTFDGLQRLPKPTAIQTFASRCTSHFMIRAARFVVSRVLVFCNLILAIVLLVFSVACFHQSSFPLLPLFFLPGWPFLAVVSPAARLDLDISRECCTPLGSGRAACAACGCCHAPAHRLRKTAGFIRTRQQFCFGGERGGGGGGRRRGGRGEGGARGGRRRGRRVRRRRA